MRDDPAKAAIRWFDGDAEAYAVRNERPTEHLDLFVAALPRRPARVLDLGCGPGRDARSLHDLGISVVGIDAAPAMIEVAKRRHPGPDYRVADMRSLELPAASFDGVLALFSLIFVPKAELPRLLSRLRTFLAPGGILLVVVQGGRPADVGESALFSVMARGEIAGLVRAAGFEVERDGERPPHPHEMAFPKIHVLARRVG